MSDNVSEKQQSEPDSKGDPREPIAGEDFALRKKERIYDGLITMVTGMVDISPTDIKPETEIIHDLGLDSLQIYELVVDLESAYDIRLSDDELERVNTVQDVVDLVYSSFD
jgi:acyl carrier protein